MSLFKPDKYYPSVLDVNYEKLKEAGIKVVACDLDNTLVPHDIKLADESVKNLVKKINDLNMKFVILSNNNEGRVSEFAKPLDIDYYYSSRKPLKKMFLRVLADNNIKADQLCLIGDQLMTDVLGANRLGIMSVYVDPIATRDIFYTKINRIMERRVAKKLARKNKFKVGEYYE